MSNQRILIIGGLGNIGRRYKAVLEHLGHTVYVFDSLGDAYQWQMDIVDRVDKIIVATPTENHFYYLSILRDCKKPILVEKPAVTSYEEVERLFDFNQQINMVCNWKYLKGMADKANANTILYNYYDCGKENINWNLAQPILLSNNTSMFKFYSPIFALMVNGGQLYTEDIQRSYIEMLENWTKDKFHLLWGMPEISLMTRKINDFKIDNEGKLVCKITAV